MDSPGGALGTKKQRKRMRKKKRSEGNRRGRKSEKQKGRGTEEVLGIARNCS